MWETTAFRFGARPKPGFESQYTAVVVPQWRVRRRQPISFSSWDVTRRLPRGARGTWQGLRRRLPVEPHDRPQRHRSSLIRPSHHHALRAARRRSPVRVPGERPQQRRQLAGSPRRGPDRGLRHPLRASAPGPFAPRGARAAGGGVASPAVVRRPRSSSSPSCKALRVSSRPRPRDRWVPRPTPTRFLTAGERYGGARRVSQGSRTVVRSGAVGERSVGESGRLVVEVDGERHVGNGWESIPCAHAWIGRERRCDPHAPRARAR